MTEIKTVKISDKGQISIPKDIREDMKLKEGETLLMISDGNKIVLEKPEKIVKKSRESDQYDKFLHQIQQQKMKELWDNKEDEAWEHV
jgi:AbrB family looped-hinge helix DNA binding protein